MKTRAENLVDKMLTAYPYCVVNVKGNIYTVTGYNTKRRSYPVSLKREDGRLSKAPVMFLGAGYTSYQTYIRGFH